MRLDDTATALSIRLFGPFEVRVCGQPLPHLSFRKSQAVLACLTLRQGREVKRDWLAGLLWPESVQSSALHSLRNCLTDLRRALGPEAGRLRSPTPRSLCLEPTGAFVDVMAFDAAIARGEPEALEAAVCLYRGPLLEGYTEEWAFAERQVREEDYLTALEKLAALALARGDPAGAERHLRLTATADPLRESTQRALMQSLAASGNYAAALLAYRELRLRLHRELNAEPDLETRALFQQLRAEARSLQARPSGRARTLLSPPRTTPLPRPRIVLRSSSLAPPMLATAESASPAANPLEVPVRGENRLVTVLFAGPTRGVETRHDQDPEEAAAIVNYLLGIMGESASPISSLS